MKEPAQVGDAENPNDKAHKSHSRFGRRFIAGCVLALAFAHIIFPSYVALDWPTVALLVIAIILLAWERVRSAVPYIKRLKLGDAEIELREKAAELAAGVEKSEENVAALVSASEKPLHAETAESSLESIAVVAATNKRAAVMLVAIELERELLTLAARHGVLAGQNTTFGAMVVRLLKSAVIPESVAVALTDFWKIRNAAAHHAVAGELDSEVLASAIDSGLRLLKVLRSLPR